MLTWHSPLMHTALEVRLHQCRAEGDNPFPGKLERLCPMHPRVHLRVGPFGCQGILLTHTQTHHQPKPPDPCPVLPFSKYFLIMTVNKKEHGNYVSQMRGLFFFLFFFEQKLDILCCLLLSHHSQGV